MGIEYRAAPYLDELTDFQRRTVNHVCEQFYGKAAASRFLVADQTGLGKTMVARGVIARAIEHLQSEQSVKRIDIVYVCSNTDLAQQNLRRLNVTGSAEIPFASRLTLLALHSRRLEHATGEGKPANLVSFTPGTSFDLGHTGGQAIERAMIMLALQQILSLGGWDRRAAMRLLMGNVREFKTFEGEVNRLASDMEAGFDPSILAKFTRNVGPDGLENLRWLITRMGRRKRIPRDIKHLVWTTIGQLRTALAAASIHALEPDLVILDEFQRFRQLLNPSSAAGELAGQLFAYEAAKVLLLSATPYRPFTLAAEQDEDHAKDLFRTLDFLARGRPDASVDEIRTGLTAYRAMALSGSPEPRVIETLRTSLLKVMTRAERPDGAAMAMAEEHVAVASEVTADDLRGYVALRHIDKLVRQPRDNALMTPGYWKSAPYFLNFCDGYQLDRRLASGEMSDDLAKHLARTQHLRADHIAAFDVVDFGNARMRKLAEGTVGQEWWRLLWVPPSLPYVEPSGVYARPGAKNMTKRLVFSSWTATPTAVASLLSYEAERRIAHGTSFTEYTPEARKRVTRHLQYRVEPKTGRPAQMTTLMTFWPAPGLAQVADPLRYVGSPQRSRASLERAVASQLAPRGNSLPTRSEGCPEDEAAPVWSSVFCRGDSWPERRDIDWLAETLTTHTDDDERPSPDGHGAGSHAPTTAGLRSHLDAAHAVIGRRVMLDDAEHRQILMEVALYGPGNIAWRCMSRLGRGGSRPSRVTSDGVFASAAILANALRTMFNRPDATKLLENLGDRRIPHWRKVMHYCADGNLEAVLDEYLFHVDAFTSAHSVTDEVLRRVATEAATALTLKTPTYRASDRVAGDELSFTPRFALRYGGRQQRDEDARQPEVRRSFNSPFWPLVLTSTSVGQEGIDFHWWCHAIFHWNTPANPVDFEQREGRVDRYRGHAIRKNVAARHGERALQHNRGENPWTMLYEMATEYREEYGDFTPGWVYPGEAKIERHVAPLPLSSDAVRYEQLKRDLSLYRLTFGQARQEDMLDLLRRRGLDVDAQQVAQLQLSLAPDTQ